MGNEAPNRLHRKHENVLGISNKPMKHPHEKNWFDIIHNCLVAFLRLAIALGILLELFEALWMNAAITAGILLLTFLPTIFASRVQVVIPPEFEVLTVAFIFASLFLGETREFYIKFWWWDIALHTTSGVLLGILGLMLVYVLNETPRVDLHMRPGFVAFFAFCFALSIGTIWEMFEFAMDQFFGMNMQKPMLSDPSGLTDTMIDLIVDAVGAMVVSIAGYLYMKRGNDSIIDRGIQRFIQRNPRLFSAGFDCLGHVGQHVLVLLTAGFDHAQHGFHEPAAGGDLRPEAQLSPDHGMTQTPLGCVVGRFHSSCMQTNIGDDPSGHLNSRRLPPQQSQRGKS